MIPVLRFRRWRPAQVVLCLLLGLAQFCTLPARAQTGVLPGVISPGASSAAQIPPASTAPSSSAPASNVPSQALLYPGDDFRLGPGDLIVVHLFGSNDYTATLRVGVEGTIDLPLIGRTEIGNLTIRDAQARIADALRAAGMFTAPEIVIQVMESLNSSVTIAGDVRAVVPVTGARRLIDVIAAAGGLPSSASHTVKIVRLDPATGQTHTIVVDLGTDLTNSSATTTLVYPRDIVEISRAGQVYVIGAFKNQGAFSLDQEKPITLLELAALSGGVGFEGKYEDLRLIRTVGAERKMVQVDIKKVMFGKAPDPVLQANDIVFLPTNSMKAILKNLGVGGVLGIVSLALSLGNF